MGLICFRVSNSRRRGGLRIAGGLPAGGPQQGPPARAPLRDRGDPDPVRAPSYLL